MQLEQAKQLLTAAGLFFDADEDDPNGQWERTLNLNDAFYWACADGVVVSDEEMPRLADLFFSYGWCGVAYWVMVEKRGGDVPEFLDQRRFIEFVAQEEELRKQEPKSSKRAYKAVEYTIGKVEALS